MVRPSPPIGLSLPHMNDAKTLFLRPLCYMLVYRHLVKKLMFRFLKDTLVIRL